MFFAVAIPALAADIAPVAEVEPDEIQTSASTIQYYMARSADYCDEPGTNFIWYGVILKDSIVENVTNSVGYGSYLEQPGF